ncbi:MAG: sigma-54 dependent transcriptional regulator [Candidatus Acidiferrales bacterium]
MAITGSAGKFKLSMTADNSSLQRILIVEDEENARKGYEALLRKWDCDVLGVGSGEDALAKFPEFNPQVILADVELPGMNGLDLLRHLGEEIQRVPVIIITGRGSDERVVQAIDAGAFWYIEKPLKPPVLRALLDRALGRVKSQQAVAALTRQLREAGKLGELVGSSRAIQEVMRQVDMAAPSTASVMITGETGSGKEIVARSIHMLSPRAERPFIAINCAAIPESLMESEIFGHEKGAFTGAAERRIGCFELAHGGTLLLDEIGEMPAQTQAKLLRVLEDHKIRRLGSKVETPVDVRVLAATNKNPEQAVANGQLRQDLYFRLNVFHIHLPPLREHKEDLPLLVDHLLEEISKKHGKKVAGVGADTMELFKSYPWPGNVRELRNVLERAAIASDRGTISRQHLPPDFGHAPAVATGGLDGVRFPVGTTVDEAERELIRQTLAATNQNKTRAAELLGISLKTLHNKLKEYEAARNHASQPEN